MKEQRIRLIYPPSLVNIPVIHQLIRRFDLTVNIYQAQIDANQGWLEILVSGEEPVIENALRWLREQGIEVINV